MDLPHLTLVLLLTGLTCYLLFGGADFGAGVWHLAAGRDGAQRKLIEHAIGPVWETNHVWLIFCLTLTWTAFPLAFAAVTSSFWVPLSLAALGIIARGSAFAFRKAGADPRSVYAAVFALSSLLTPFFLGTVAGGVLTGRATGPDPAGWTGPVPLYAGALTVGCCAYLAAVYLTADARRHHGTLAETFRTRALGTGCLVGAMALTGPFVVRADAPELFTALTGRGLGLVALSAAAGGLSLVLLVRRRYVAVRASAALAVASLLWGSAVASYPRLGRADLTVAATAADPAVLAAVLTALGIGAVILVPSMLWLYTLFQRQG